MNYHKQFKKEKCEDCKYKISIPCISIQICYKEWLEAQRNKAEKKIKKYTDYEICKETSPQDICQEMQEYFEDK